MGATAARTRSRRSGAWQGRSVFAVSVAESPIELEAVLADKLEQGYGARMAAGYCWPWSDPRNGRHARARRADRRLGAAVEPQGRPERRRRTARGAVGDRGRRASARSAASTPRRASSTTGAASSSAPICVWRGGRFVAPRERTRTRTSATAQRVDDAQFDRLVRNVYKVLLTRGMVGTVLYSTDEETQEALLRLVPSRALADA